MRDLRRLEAMSRYDADARAELEREKIRRGEIQVSPDGHQLQPHHARKFIFAGRALFTIVNKSSGRRFTYKVNKSSRVQTDFWVNVLTGSDNEESYSTLGVTEHPGEIRKALFKHTSKQIGKDALSAKSWRWFFWMLQEHHDFPEGFEVWHQGCCGACGRTLTVPTSIKIGFGPDCAERLGMGSEFAWTAHLKDGRQLTGLRGASERRARESLRETLDCKRLPRGIRLEREVQA